METIEQLEELLILLENYESKPDKDNQVKLETYLEEIKPSEK